MCPKIPRKIFDFFQQRTIVPQVHNSINVYLKDNKHTNTYFIKPDGFVSITLNLALNLSSYRKVNFSVIILKPDNLL